MFTLIGLSQSSGEYNGKAYDNIVMYLTYESDKVNGIACKVEKIKREDFDKNVKVGNKVKLFYNQYGKVIQVCIA